MRPLLAALLAVALLAAGCGETDDTADFTGEEKRVADVVAALETAAVDDDAARICRELLAEQVRERLGDDCERQVDAAFEDADSVRFSIDSVRVEGESARARISSGRDDEQQDLVQLVREGNRWRISAIGSAR
jgi:hypothetical protein